MSTPTNLDPCPWPLDSSCCDGWDGFTDELRAACAQMATEVLWALSGRQFSECELTIRPCRRHASACSCDTCGWGTGMWGTGLAFVPYLLGGQWFNAPCGACPDTGCSCSATVAELELPGPVNRVETVYIDGAVFTDWALYDLNTLVRTDGQDWPRCQDLAADLTAQGTWAVTYVRGTPVPLGGRRAAGILACELAKACTGGKCRIPWQVTNVTRDGVSWTFDPTEFYTQGLTGIPEVDLWLSAVNAGKNRRPSAVYTPQTLGRDRVRRSPREVFPS